MRFSVCVPQERLDASQTLKKIKDHWTDADGKQNNANIQMSRITGSHAQLRSGSASCARSRVLRRRRPAGAGRTHAADQNKKQFTLQCFSTRKYRYYKYTMYSKGE